MEKSLGFQSVLEGIEVPLVMRKPWRLGNGHRNDCPHLTELVKHFVTLERWHECELLFPPGLTECTLYFSEVATPFLPPRPFCLHSPEWKEKLPLTSVVPPRNNWPWFLCLFENRDKYIDGTIYHIHTTREILDNKSEKLGNEAKCTSLEFMVILTNARLKF